MDNPSPIIISLSSGVGMLDQAVELVFPQARVACFAEWESYAASILMARMEDKAMEPAPIWCGDIGDLDARPFLGVVDILTAGLPCQPYSLAGKRQGNSDARSFGEGDGPLPHCLRIIAECRPALVFLENVPAWVRSGWFRQFGEQLSGLGYEISHPLFLSAGDVGASHERERVFILAESARELGRPDAAECGREVDDSDGERFGEAWRGDSRRDVGRTGDEMADSECPKWWPDDERRGHLSEGEDRAREEASGVGECREALGDPTSIHKHRTVVRELPLFAPGPNSPEWGTIIEAWPHLAPAIEPGFRQLAHRQSVVVDASRADQLRCVGNGVVAIQAALALAVLLKRLNQ